MDKYGFVYDANEARFTTTSDGNLHVADSNKFTHNDLINTTNKNYDCLGFVNYHPETKEYSHRIEGQKSMDSRQNLQTKFNDNNIPHYRDTKAYKKVGGFFD